jgi:L-amino acid N-acyltransferase YncA
LLFQFSVYRRKAAIRRNSPQFVRLPYICVVNYINMPQPLLIRAALPGDVPGILEIYNDAILNTTAVYTYDPLTVEMLNQWYKEKQDKGLPVFVAEIGGRVAGFASYGPFRPWPAYKYSVEHSIYVNKDFRRQGIAKKLLRVLIDKAEASGLHTIVAGIDSANVVSISLHREFGFREAGMLAQVGYKFGRWLDLQFMQLILSNDISRNEN